MDRSEITQEFVKARFDYKDGKLYYKTRPSTSVHIGDLAQTMITDKQKSRYQTGIGGKNYYVSRIVFLYHKGYMPDFVDHKDHDTLNNRIENLRAATRRQNNMNTRGNKNTSSKYKGVFYVERAKRWAAQIRINNKSTHIGYYLTEDEAGLAYNEKAELHFGEFAFLNSILA